jgi:hypothetical protein
VADTLTLIGEYAYADDFKLRLRVLTYFKVRLRALAYFKVRLRALAYFKVRLRANGRWDLTQHLKG